jgi:hypothetical protein
VNGLALSWRTTLTEYGSQHGPSIPHNWLVIFHTPFGI